MENLNLLTVEQLNEKLLETSRKLNLMIFEVTVLGRDDPGADEAFSSLIEQRNALRYELMNRQQSTVEGLDITSE